MWAAVHLLGEGTGSKAEQNAPWLPESQAKWNCPKLAGSYFLMVMPGRRWVLGVMWPESINSLLAQINRLVGSVDFRSPGNIHESLHRDVTYLGNTPIMMSRLEHHPLNTPSAPPDLPPPATCITHVCMMVMIWKVKGFQSLIYTSQNNRTVTVCYVVDDGGV